MNKFKKVMLGALSVLTLGLFVATGARVNADTTEVAGTDYWELHRTSSATVNTGNYFTLSNVTEKGTSVTNPSGYTTYAGGALTLGKNWQITQGETNYIGFTTGDNTAGYILTIIVAPNGANKDTYLKLNGNNMDVIRNSTSKALCMITTDLSASTNYTISKGTESHYLNYISVSKKHASTNSYTISFDANGHGTAPSDVENVSALNSTILNESITGVEGYRFDGWYMDSNCSIAASSTIDLDSYDPNSTGVITLYAKWVQTKTISFYDPANTSKALKTTTFDYNDTISYAPLKESNSFAGWFTDVECENELASNVVGSTTPTTLYAKFVPLSYDGDPNYLSSDYIAGNYISSETAATTKTNLVGLNFYLMKDLIKKNMSIGSENKDVIFLGGTGTAGTSRTLGFNCPSNGMLTIKVYATGNRVWEVKNMTTNSVVKTTETLAQNTVHTINVNVSKDNVYEMYCKNDKCYIVEAKFVETAVSFNCQYDTEKPADATKIRFIASIDGIADVTTIDTVTFSITVGQVTREFKCTQLYTSISNKYTGFGAATGRYYAVYALNNIQTAIASGATFASMSVTVTFTTESGLNPINAIHAGFKLGTKGE